MIDRAVREVEITDVHTHIYSTAFGDLLLSGIDELLTYHYLVSEMFRWVDLPYEEYWAMPKAQQADLVWQTLFVEHSPYSEACRGVLTVLEKLGLDVSTRDLEAYRAYFRAMPREEYVNRVFALSNIREVVMTNDPFDDAERPTWLHDAPTDPRFKAALRIDALLNSWETAWPRLREWGYAVSEELSEDTLGEVRRFLRDWMTRISALYLAVSLPPDFRFPEVSVRGTLIAECILPLCREMDRPFALMIGVKKLVNPALRLAGDSVGKGDINVVEYLCAHYPHNKFMVTMLSRENQHELCVAARKFRNLLVFGCWWFLNNPSLIDEMTRMRFELLGLSTIPQHSDARVLDQLIYKWEHSRRIIADALFTAYSGIVETGWQVREEEIRRDVAMLFGGNFWSFLQRTF
jgi:hypothetical protein